MVEVAELLLEMEDVAAGTMEDGDEVSTIVAVVELLLVRSDCWNLIATLYAFIPPYPENVRDDA